MTFLRFAPAEGHDTINSNFNKIFNDFPKFDFDVEVSVNPKIDIWEDANSINVEAELAGFKKENLKISIQENVLTIEGEKKNLVDENNERKNLRNERTFGSFKRSFSLPEDANAEAVKANFEDGVLTISITKIVPEAPKERTIEIK